MTQKWNLQDIRPAQPKKRRVRKMPKPVTNSQQPRAREERTEDEVGRMGMQGNTSSALNINDDVNKIVIENGTRKNTNRLYTSIALFVLIVGGAIALSALLGKSELTIYPEHRTPNVSAEFTAYPDKRQNALSYEIMTLEAVNESQVKATGQVQIEELATGVIEIVKTTTGAERLIKNTRFRTPDGLVFRIKESVVVPGAVKDSSGTSVPGVIQAEVFADDVGEEYNLEAGQTFDIPGFKENNFTELYNAITARNTTAFSGGFSGPQFQINEDELSTARQEVQIALRDTLLGRIENEKPADFIAFPNAVAITYNQLPAVEYGQDLVTIREQAILQIPLFKMTDLGSFLAKETVATYGGGEVRIDDPTAIKFNYSSPTTSASVIANEPSLTFSLTGKPLLIWNYDAKALTRDLAGLPKTAINNAVTAYPGIDAAKVHITPFWQRNFPEDPEEIIIIEELKEIE